MQNDLIRLDTATFDNLISKRQELLKKYDDINLEYDRIIMVLMSNWKGDGATAFKKDSEKVKANMTGINDILKTMCDTLEDCLEIFHKVDTKLGEFNTNPETE